MKQEMNLFYGVIIMPLPNEISRFLSKVIGFYLIIISLAMIVNHKEFVAHVSILIYDKPLMFVMGFFTIILGLLMVVSHNIWQWNWRVLVTIIGWITLLKGATILFSPTFLDAKTHLFLQSAHGVYIAAVIDFVLGILLCYFGFRKTQ